MSVNSQGNRILPPVSIYDLQRMFNVVLTKTGESNKLSADLGTNICKNVGDTVDGWTVYSRNNINKWAKYKPVKIANNVGLITDAQRLSVEYGIINIPKWSRLDRLETFWVDENTSSSTNYPACGLFPFEDYWKYDVPTGTTAAPFRLADFVQYPVTANNYGYFRDAEPEITEIDADLDGTYSKTIYISPQGHMRINWHSRSDQSAMGLSYADFNVPNTQTSLGGCYYGGILRRTGGGTKYTMTQYGVQDQTLSDIDQNGAHLDVYFASISSINEFMTGNSLQKLDTQTFYVTPILSSTTMYDTFTVGSSTYHTFTTTNHAQISGTFLTITEREQITINLRYAQLTLSNCYAYKDTSQSTRLIYYEFDVTNNETTVGTNRVYKITIHMVDKNGNTVGSDGILTGTINAGQTLHLTGSRDAGSSYSAMSNGGYITFTADFDPTYNTNLILKKTDTETAYISDTPPIIPT